MSFTRKSANLTPIEDTVFAVVKKAKEAKQKVGQENVVDATIGSLYSEEGKIVAFDSVFTNYNAIDKETKAAYAVSFTGNPSYREQVYKWVKGNANLKLNHSVIATPGGSGAVSLTIKDILDKGETLVLPDIAWGSYALMASDSGLDYVTYQMFDGDAFNLKSFKDTCLKVMEKQDKLLVVINDPCHNPTGYSMIHEEWKEVISFINECAKKVPCVILDDIAYIDYSYDLEYNHKYMETFNNISENVMVVVAFSCSKTLTSYGLRCGAAVLLAKDSLKVREVEIVFEKTARAIWSNVSNSAMDNFTEVTTTHLNEYMNEKDKYISLLKERSTIFLTEAKEVGLNVYPYHEGFFVTVMIENNELRNKYHEALMQEHIYTVCVNKGIRVAVCSLSVKHCKGLAKKMKMILDNVKEN